MSGRSRQPIEDRTPLEPACSPEASVGWADPRGNDARQAALNLSNRGSGPLGGPLDGALEACFGPAVRGLQAGFGERSANAEIGAVAHAAGRRLSFGEAVDPEGGDGLSLEVIGHEVAHALGAGGAPRTLLNQPGDPGEHQADQAGAAFRRYVEGGARGPAPQIAPARGGRAAIHRWEIEAAGSSYGTPAHELLTAKAVELAMQKNLGEKNRFQLFSQMGFTKEDMRVADGPGGPQLKLQTQDVDLVNPYDGSPIHVDGGDLFPTDAPFQMPGVTQLPKVLGPLLRGVQLNDTMDRAYKSPDGGMSDQPSKLKELGEGWDIKYGDPKEHPENLLMQSHNGDLSFLHGMEGEAGVDPKETQKKMHAYSQAVIQFIQGTLPPDTKLSEIEGLQDAFGGPGTKDLTLAQLYAGQGKDPKDTDLKTLQTHALGSLLHMVQDSYAGGHVKRDANGQILQFQTYPEQDHDAHGDSDKLKIGEGETFDDALAKNPLALQAVNSSADILAALDRGASEQELMKIIDEQVLTLSPDAKPSGVAPGYQKAKPQQGFPIIPLFDPMIYQSNVPTTA